VKSLKIELRAIALIIAAALLAPGCATEDKTAAAAAPAAASVGSRSLPVLKVGATADEIVRLVGKPLAVEAMPSKEGKAETWTYRRLLDEETTQVAEAPRGAPVIDPAHGIYSAGAEISETEFHTAYVKTY